MFTYGVNLVVNREGIIMRLLHCVLFTILLAGSLQGEILSERVSPSIENGSVFIGSQNLSGQLAVTEAYYNGSLEKLVLLAVSTGNQYIKLYSYDDGSGTLTFLENITVTSGIPFDVSFIDLPVGLGGTYHSCMVIPRWDRYFSNIDIYDVQTCTPHLDCWNTATANQVYHISDLENGSYGINAENVITVCTFDALTKQFINSDRIPPENVFYGASSTCPPARTFETQLYGYNCFGLTGNACITTMHNGGIRIWDPQTHDILSRIGVGQQGGSGSHYCDVNGNVVVDGELGDVHRAAILNGADITTELGVIASRLLFFSNHTMGFMIYDISIPDAPQYVWQWDNDVRLGSGAGQFDWHSAGCDNKEIALPNNPPALIPGNAFGIGLRAVYGQLQDDIIHVFVADGRFGLLAFDFGNFLSPFGYDDECNYRSVVIDEPIYYLTPEEDPFMAHDLRTLDYDGGTLVFTSWKENKEQEETGFVGLSVHRDGSAGLRNGLPTASLSSDAGPFSLHTISPNPVSGSQHFVFSGCDQEVEMMIYDSVGRLVLEQRIPAYEGLAEYSWDCSGSSGARLQLGAYYIRAECGDLNSTSKIVILN